MKERMNQSAPFHTCSLKINRMKPAYAQPLSSLTETRPVLCPAAICSSVITSTSATEALVNADVVEHIMRTAMRTVLWKLQSRRLRSLSASDVLTIGSIHFLAILSSLPQSEQ